MIERCPTPEELAELRNLSADDPRAIHVAGCAGCQALLASLESFMDPVDLPTDADLPDARLRLDAALEQEIRGEAATVVRPRAAFWSPFRVRAAAAAAAVVVVAVGLSLVGGDPQLLSEDPVLRSSDETTAPFDCVVENLESGARRLSWPPMAEAETYMVIFFSADLEESGHVDAGLLISIELAAPAGAAFCRVIALRGGDEIARSRPAYFR